MWEEVGCICTRAMPGQLIAWLGTALLRPKLIPMNPLSPLNELSSPGGSPCCNVNLFHSWSLGMHSRDFSILPGPQEPGVPQLAL